MATIIKIYSNTGIRPEKNAVIDDIADYLATKSSLTYSVNRFIEHDTSVSVKIDTHPISPASPYDTATENITPFNSRKFDYAAIKNERDDDFVYYYILNKKWTATKTLTLELAIDSLTSFANAYEFTPRTLVEREHKDRFFNYPVQISGQTYLPRRLYLDGDGITPQLYHDAAQDDDIENVNAPDDWYLVYVANNTTGATEGKDYPVNAFLVSGNGFVVNRTYYRLNISNLDEGKMYWFGEDLTNSYPLGAPFIIDEKGYAAAEINCIYYEEISRPESTTGRWVLKKQTANSAQQLVAVLKNSSVVSFFKNKSVYITNYAGDIFGTTSAATAAKVINRQTGTASFSLEQVNREINSIETVDRTDTRLISAIKLPYCPADINLTEGEEYFPEYVIEKDLTWQNDNTFYYLKISTNYLEAFENEFQIGNYALLLYQKKNEINDTRDDKTESALYRSEFYQIRFVYDSFVYPLPFETLADDFLKQSPVPTGVKIKIATTSTMNSRFLFDFCNENKAFKFKVSEQDYPHIMVIARNNNIVLYNSEYINYMRNGYNYDVKAKNAALLNAGLNIGAGVLSTGIGLITGGVGGNIRAGAQAAQFTKEAAQAAALSESLLTAGEMSRGAAQTPYINAAIGQANTAANAYKQAQAAAKKYNPTANVLALGQAINGVTGIIKGVQQIQQTEREFTQKQHAIRQASVSVSSSDDIDLLTYYSHNRLKSEVWQCSARMKKALADLYYYQGYATNEQKVPTHNNRKWFDFLKCQADIKNIKNLDQRFIDNIKDRLAIGATFYHAVNGVWDIEQTKGNPETWI